MKYNVLDIPKEAEFIFPGYDNVCTDKKFFYKKNDKGFLLELEKQSQLINHLSSTQSEIFFEKNNNPYIRMEYFDLRDIDEHTNVNFLFSELNDIFEKWKHYRNSILKEWEDVKKELLTYIKYGQPDEVDTIKYFKNLGGNSFIHGDFTLANVKIKENHLFVVDYENASYGPKDFDKYIFIYSLLKKNIYETGRGLMEKFGLNYNELRHYCVLKYAISIIDETDDVEMRKQTLKNVSFWSKNEITK